VSLVIVIVMNSDSHDHLAERVGDLVEYLKLQKHETIDALTNLAQAEDRLAHSQSR
jgi:hypothetical protein